MDLKTHYKSPTNAPGTIQLRIHIHSISHNFIWVCGSLKNVLIYVIKETESIQFEISHLNISSWLQTKDIGFDCRAITDLPIGVNIIILSVNQTNTNEYPTSRLTHVITWP